ncbi:hypothetical protein [Actinocrispum sp. NPDC049592]|uniref:hypothetical protein n=1 Tax=Actinocrispum sp. NPDC049592 TaxID=3154835 RepID=UPI003422D4E2
MKRRLASVAAATLGIALTLTGCGSSDSGGQNAAPSSSGSAGASAPASGTGGSGGGSSSPEASAPPPQPSNGDPVKWVDNLCAPVSDFTKSITQKASDLGSAAGDQNQIQAKLGQLLDDMANGVGGLVDRLKQLEPSPIKGADDAKAKMIESYGKSQQVLKDAAAKMKAGDQDAAAAAMQSLGDETTKIADPFKDLQNNELRDAMSKAPRCKDIAGG